MSNNVCVTCSYISYDLTCFYGLRKNKSWLSIKVGEQLKVCVSLT